MSEQVLTRVVRRETHSPRTAAAVVVLVLVAACAVYTGVEIVLRLQGLGPLLVAPKSALAWLAAAPSEVDQPAVVAGGVILALVGILLIWLSIGSGRRPKHELRNAGHAVVVDNGVIASAVAERVRRELDAPKGAVVVGIGHRSADVTVRPESGQTIDGSRVRALAERELEDYGLSPRLRVRARVQRTPEREDF